MIQLSTRVSYAFRCFFSVLFDGEIPQDIALELAIAPAGAKTTVPAAAESKASEKPPVESFDRSVQMLSCRFMRAFP